MLSSRISPARALQPELNRLFHGSIQPFNGGSYPDGTAALAAPVLSLMAFWQKQLRQIKAFMAEKAVI
jgi:hypothetical protein